MLILVFKNEVTFCCLQVFEKYSKGGKHLKKFGVSFSKENKFIFKKTFST